MMKQKHSPQRHRDTEKSKAEKNKALNVGFVADICWVWALSQRGGRYE